MEKMKKVLFGLLTAIMLISFPVTEMSPQFGMIRAEAASINKKTAKLSVGKTTTLKIKGAKGKIKWKSSNTEVATVSSKGKVTGVPRRIIVLTYRNHTADYYRRIPFHVYLNVLCFTARFFLFILTISSLTRIVFHETKKRERTAPPTVRSFSHLMCVPQAVP